MKLLICLALALPVCAQQVFPPSSGSGTAPTFNNLTVTGLTTPAAPTVTPTCSGTCATTYSYVAVAKLQDGSHTAASAVGSTSANAATLDSTHTNAVATAAVTSSASCDVYRTVGGATQGKIATAACGATVTDNGLAGGSSAAPTSNTTGAVSASVFYSPNGARNIAAFGAVSDGVTSINTALTNAIADLPSTGGDIYIPASSTAYAVSSTISISKNVTITCGGSSSEENAGHHETARLVYTGGAAPMFTVSGVAASGFRLVNCGLNNTGSVTVFIDIDSAAGSTELHHVVISNPAVAASVAAVRYGHTSNVTSSIIIDSVVNAAAPIGLAIENVSAHFQMQRSHIMANSTANVRLGTSTTAARNVQFSQSTFEASTNLTGIDVLYAQKFRCAGCYFESGGTGFAVDVSSGAQIADNIEVTGSWFTNIGGASSPVRSAFASADILLVGNLLLGFPSPHYVLTNTASRSVMIVGNTSTTAGFNVATALTNVSHFSNASGGTGIIDPWGRFNSGAGSYPVIGEANAESYLFAFQNRTVATDLSVAMKGYQGNDGSFFWYNNNLQPLTWDPTGHTKINVGGSATKIVCYKADGKTLGFATMAAGDISACN